MAKQPANAFTFLALMLDQNINVRDNDSPNSMDVLIHGDRQPFSVYPSNEVCKDNNLEQILPHSTVRVKEIVAGKSRVNQKGNSINTPNLRVTGIELVAPPAELPESA